MRNPLNKRIKRKIYDEKIKFVSLVLFLMVIIGFCSGAVIVTDDLKETYESAKETFHREDGNFSMERGLDRSLIQKLEETHALKIHENFYLEKNVIKTPKEKSLGTARIFRLSDRKQVNQISVLSGRMPKKEDEIILDRLYCENNHIACGDRVWMGETPFIVTGYSAFPDYSCLFSDNTDLMFDAQNFSVGAVTGTGFGRLKAGRQVYNYTWTYRTAPKSEKKEKEVSDAFLSDLGQDAAIKGNGITEFVPAYLSQAITFTDRDFDGDRGKTLLFLYILIAVMALIFATEITGDMDRDAKMIGCMKTLGYTEREIAYHYLAIPVLEVLCGGVLGNIGGYTFFRSLVEKLYLHSYSLTKTVHTFNREAFLLTTCVPALLIFVITYGIIKRRLSQMPLDFLNENLDETAALRRNLKGSFIKRFQKRVILNSKAVYACLFVGIFFSNWMMFYGTMMQPALKRHEKAVNETRLSNYRYYVLPGTEIQSGEKFTLYKMKTCQSGMPKEEIKLYGISPNSRFFTKKTAEIPDDGSVLVSIGMKEKYDLQKGETFRLKRRYEDRSETFQVGGFIDQPEGLGVYMTREKLNKVMGEKTAYYNGCYSDKKLDIPEKQVVQRITVENLQKATKQLVDSTGDFFGVMKVVSVCLYVLVIYLLSKEVIEKNRRDIAMLEILGYRGRDIKKIFILPTRWMFILFLLINMPLGVWLAKVSFYHIMRRYNGWMSFYVSPYTYPVLFLTGLSTYLVIERVVYKKMTGIQMTEVLMDE